MKKYVIPGDEGGVEIAHAVVHADETVNSFYSFPVEHEQALLPA